MGAIAGIIGKCTENEIHKMQSRLLHRGQISTVLKIDKNVTLINLSKDKIQNVIDNDQSVSISDFLFFDQNSDSKHFSNSYNLKTLSDMVAEKNTVALSQWNGYFAHAAWNKDKQELHLARDLLGAQPLYYSVLPSGGLAFASEYKAILALDEVVSCADLDMLQCLQNCKKLPAGRTLFNNIFSVKEGTILSFNSKGEILSEEKMPALKVDVKYSDEDKTRSLVSEKLIASCAKRSINKDDPIGIALSGGIDSIALVCIYRYLYPDREIHTYTAGFGETDTELSTAAFVADKMNTIHHEIITPPQLMLEKLPELVWHMEDPYSRSEALQLFQIAREASKHVDIIFSGLAADALFGGMPKHRLLWLIKKFPMFKGPFTDVYEFTQSGLPGRTLLGKLLIKYKFLKKMPKPPSIIGSNFTSTRRPFPKNNKQLINTITSSGFIRGVSQDFVKFERNFSAFGVLHTSPFHDPAFIDFAYQIDDSLKITAKTRKYILRQALIEVVPPEVINVPKLPQRMQYDLEFSSVMDEVVEKYLNKAIIEKRGYFDYQDIQRLQNRPSGKPYSDEAGMRLWTAVLTELWAQTFIDNKGSKIDDFESKVENTGVQ